MSLQVQENWIEFDPSVVQTVYAESQSNIVIWIHGKTFSEEMIENEGFSLVERLSLK